MSTKTTAQFKITEVTVTEHATRAARLEVMWPDPDDYEDDDAGFNEATDRMQGFEVVPAPFTIRTEMPVQPGDVVTLTMEAVAG